MSVSINPKFIPPGIKGESLTMIVDGGLQTAGYFVQQGISPDVVITDLALISDLLPYLPMGTDVLVVVNNATDFTLYTLNTVVQKLVESSFISSVTVISNINLGALCIPYYIYKGRPLSGEVEYVKGGERISLFKKEPFKRGLGKGYADVEQRINPVMTPFLVFKGEKNIRKYVGRPDKVVRLDDDVTPLSFEFTGRVRKNG